MQCNAMQCKLSAIQPSSSDLSWVFFKVSSRSANSAKAKLAAWVVVPRPSKEHYRDQHCFDWRAGALFNGNWP